LWIEVFPVNQTCG